MYCLREGPRRLPRHRRRGAPPHRPGVATAHACCSHEGGQTDVGRATGQPGRAQAGQIETRQVRASRQRGDEGAGHVAPAGLGPADDESSTGPVRRGQSPRRQLGAHGNAACTRPAHRNDHAAGARRDVRAGHQAQVGSEEPGAGAERDQPAGALATSLGGLGVAEGQIRGQLGLCVGSERPFARQGSPTRAAAGPLGGQEQQVRTGRAPSRSRPPRRASSHESFDKGLAQEDLFGFDADAGPIGTQTRRRPEQGSGPGHVRQIETPHHRFGERGAGQAVGRGTQASRRSASSLENTQY